MFVYVAEEKMIYCHLLLPQQLLNYIIQSVRLGHESVLQK